MVHRPRATLNSSKAGELPPPYAPDVADDEVGLEACDESKI